MTWLEASSTRIFLWGLGMAVSRWWLTNIVVRWFKELPIMTKWFKTVLSICFLLLTLNQIPMTMTYHDPICRRVAGYQQTIAGYQLFSAHERSTNSYTKIPWKWLMIPPLLGSAGSPTKNTTICRASTDPERDNDGPGASWLHGWVVMAVVDLAHQLCSAMWIQCLLWRAGSSSEPTNTRG